MALSTHDDNCAAHRARDSAVTSACRALGVLLALGRSAPVVPDAMARVHHWGVIRRSGAVAQPASSAMAAAAAIAFDASLSLVGVCAVFPAVRLSATGSVLPGGGRLCFTLRCSYPPDHRA